MDQSPFDKKLGLTIQHASADQVSGWADVDGNTQPAGLWHGGASATMVETLGSLGAQCHAETLGKVAVGTDLSVSHLRAVRSGTVYGNAHAVHLGRSSAVYEVQLFDDNDQMIASGRITCRLVSRPPADI